MRTLLRIIISIRFTPILKCIKHYDSKSENIIIIFPNRWENFYHYAIGSFQSDLINMRCLIDRNEKFKIHFGPNFGKYHNKNIFLSFGMETNLYGFDNHSAPLQFWLKELESQGNRCFHNYKDALLWENKIYMHEYFEKKKVRSPKTKLLAIGQLEKNEQPFAYPYIIKWPHSAGSEGLYPIKDETSYDAFIEKYKHNKSSQVVVQEQLNMRMDIRVICTKGRVVWHYWRINLGDTWKPTSTGHGSKVDFENFPEKWRSWIIDQFDRLDIFVGAFDIAWQDDDLETEPYILEVSPSFSPNPIPADKSWLPKYGKYKKKAMWRNSYIEEHMLLQYKIRKIVLDDYKNG